MMTRSKTKTLLKQDSLIASSDEFIIDFDEASKAWRENKVYIGNGSFRYKKNKKQRK